MSGTGPATTQMSSNPGTGPGPLLDIRELCVEFGEGARAFHALNGVNLAVAPAAAIAILGESGCGKSVTSLAVTGLLGRSGRVTGGSISFNGHDLLGMSKQALNRVRGVEIGMIFQDALSALNPTLTVGYQMRELLRTRMGLSRSAARTRAKELLDAVGIADPGRCARSFPHQLSGGMRQRVLIAMAVSLEPKLLICDEPTTALDATIQAQVIELLKTLRRDMNMSLIFITHDVGVAAEIADDVAVMYAGRVIECGPVRDVFDNPAHPYTKALLGARPAAAEGGRTLATLPGAVPDLVRVPDGCLFEPRCARRADRCRAEYPALLPISANHASACHFREEVVNERP
ncbi:ABC transporter ATP-binding protein [Actinoallomurus iriomotensis]|uniref:ABC transporter ATP-binding protein n=1 Tax=Actinoallomurus iriomotensis TaxID=478107 RepID=A0A9W6RXY3_9ACTN|nr:ABC transporter ATP-binding protein [Actinoallomurus iriomotensis]GLY82142.1 ABC transporter ATP-binding protein [Actinoallomurus iriomotensis]